MRKDITVVAQPRASRGKNEARRQRVNHLSPAVLYGAGKDSVAVSVSPKEIEKILHSASGRNTIFNLDVQGVENTPVMIVDAQRDPIKQHLLHADLQRIDLSKPIVVAVPIHLQGEPKGVKQQGGTLEVVTRSISVRCLPDDIPEHLSFNVAEMMVGDAIRASQIALPGSMELIGNADQVLAHVVGMKAEETPAAEAGAAAPAEPEVIKKGKKEAEGEAPAAGKDAKPAAGKDAKPAAGKDAKKK